MIKKIFFIISIFILYSNCSFDTKSGIWTNSEKIEKITEVKETILFKKKNYDIKEFNKDLLIEMALDSEADRTTKILKSCRGSL